MESKGEYKSGDKQHSHEDCVRLAVEISGSVREIGSDIESIVVSLVEVPKIKDLIDENAEDIYATMDAVATVMAGIRGVVAGANKIGKLPKSVRAFMVRKAIGYFAKKSEE